MQSCTDINHKLLSWIPKNLIPYAILARIDRPIGIWLLFLPCLWGLSLSEFDIFYTKNLTNTIYLNIKYFFIFLIGSLLARSAGCIWNDILDRNIDAKIKRTASRPLANKQISLFHAVIFLLIILMFAFLVTLFFLPNNARYISWFGIGLAIIYPFMKRITNFPQVWLGLTFNWGIPTSYFVFQKHVTWSFVILYLASILWTIGYDTIYALQDIDEDSVIGVKSTAILFGNSLKSIVIFCYIISCLLLMLIGIKIKNIMFWPIYISALWYIFHKLCNLQVNDKKQCLAFFKANTFFGFLITCSLFIRVFS